ncbi:alpha/beta hydrolase [soil metagenome]
MNRARLAIARRSERRSGFQPRRSVVSLPPYEIHALDVGAGAEPLVLLHGLSGSGRWWNRNLVGLSRDRRVLVPDIIGFGDTRCPGPIPSIAELAAILNSWMEHLGVESADVAGHSMGGQIAVHLAAHFPERVRRLVLVDSAGLHPAPTPRTLARFAADILPPVRWGDPTFLPIILRDSLRAGPRSITRSLAHILTENVGPLLQHITAPTLVLWGRRDSFVPLEHAREFRARIPDAQLLVLDRAAHNPMVDCPLEFNQAVLRFLQGERVGE